jgi:hypothetical protein
MARLHHTNARKVTSRSWTISPVLYVFIAIGWVLAGQAYASRGPFPSGLSLPPLVHQPLSRRDLRSSRRRRSLVYCYF